MALGLLYAITALQYTALQISTFRLCAQLQLTICVHPVKINFIVMESMLHLVFLCVLLVSTRALLVLIFLTDNALLVILVITVQEDPACVNVILVVYQVFTRVLLVRIALTGCVAFVSLGFTVQQESENILVIILITWTCTVRVHANYAHRVLS